MPEKELLTKSAVTFVQPIQPKVLINSSKVGSQQVLAHSRPAQSNISFKHQKTSGEAPQFLRSKALFFKAPLTPTRRENPFAHFQIDAKLIESFGESNKRVFYQASNLISKAQIPHEGTVIPRGETNVIPFLEGSIHMLGNPKERQESKSDRSFRSSNDRYYLVIKSKSTEDNNDDIQKLQKDLEQQKKRNMMLKTQNNNLLNKRNALAFQNNAEEVARMAEALRILKNKLSNKQHKSPAFGEPLRLRSKSQAGRKSPSPNMLSRPTTQHIQLPKQKVSK